MAKKVSELWVTIRLGKTPEERRQLERERLERETERQASAMAKALREFGYEIEPVVYPRRIDGEWSNEA